MFSLLDYSFPAGTLVFTVNRQVSETDFGDRRSCNQHVCLLFIYKGYVLVHIQHSLIFFVDVTLESAVIKGICYCHFLCVAHEIINLCQKKR